MAPRPNWKGYLKLSLVSCPVALYSATSTSERVRFHIINRKTGNRVHNVVVDAETEKPVEDEDRVKGYEVRKGEHILVEDEELEQVALESTHTIEIESFIPRKEVDEIYLDESYYIVPTGGGVADDHGRHHGGDDDFGDDDSSGHGGNSGPGGGDDFAACEIAQVRGDRRGADVDCNAVDALAKSRPYRDDLAAAVNGDGDLPAALPQRRSAS